MYWNDTNKNVKVVLHLSSCFTSLDKAIFILPCQKKKNKIHVYTIWSGHAIMFFGLVDSIVYSYTTCIWDYVSTEQNEQF